MASCYYDAYGRRRCNNSAWNNWARWLVLALIVLGAIFIFFLFSCLTARRRRRRGLEPFRGTGWAAGGTPAGHAPATYTNAQPYYQNQTTQQQQPYYNNSNNPPPTYQPGGGANQSYYGGQQNGVELQQPQNAYMREAEGAYAPPSEPPPGKVRQNGMV
ncbi:hypothetical protein LTR50_006305 [Elasticomyces elasticus]|nr:hypothetical protein LTR50_006305 [Elasticomyces elasticus]